MKIRVLMNFLRYYVRFENPDVKTGHCHAVVENLILKLGFSDEQAASIAEISLDFVKKVRSELKGK